jgi:hypothetical protein
MPGVAVATDAGDAANGADVAAAAEEAAGGAAAEGAACVWLLDVLSSESNSLAGAASFAAGPGAGSCTFAFIVLSLPKPQRG